MVEWLWMAWMEYGLQISFKIEVKVIFAVCEAT